MYASPSDLNRKFAGIGRAVAGKTGMNKIKAGLRALQDHGLVSDQSNLAQIQEALRVLPGPFGSGNPNNEIASFLDYAEQYADDFDPTGLPGGRFSGFGMPGDPRDDFEAGRENCDMFGVIAGDVAAGSTGANATLTNSATDTVYKKAVMWLWTAGGKVRNIVSITKDGRPFFLGPSVSIPADLCDVSLEPHPMRQGIYLGDVNRSLAVTAFIETSATAVHWEVLLDAEIEGQSEQRPGGRILRRWKLGA